MWRAGNLSGAGRGEEAIPLQHDHGPVMGLGKGLHGARRAAGRPPHDPVKRTVRFPGIRRWKLSAAAISTARRQGLAVNWQGRLYRLGRGSREGGASPARDVAFNGRPARGWVLQCWLP